MYLLRTTLLRRATTMTAQISDTVRYGGHDYDLAGINGEGLFEPSQQGLAPFARSTACWRGYFCEYTIEGGVLLLDALHIALTEKDADPADDRTGPRVFDLVPRYDVARGYWVYAPVRVPIPFTGGLLLGRTFIRALYVHMGFHPAWKYRQVYEVIFQNGRLRESYDRSREVEEYRSHVRPSDLDPGISASRQEIHNWVRQAFSLHYDR
jgi:hypothetical protein